MSYNLLLDTSFNKMDNWKFTNCRYEDGYLISSDKVFGIEQQLILPNPTKLYFRWNYKIETQGVNNVYIGIQNGKILNADRRVPRINKNQTISVIDNAKSEKITLQFIFESRNKENKVSINSPILVDLNHLGKSTWLKWILDRTIFFMNGYSYTNLYSTSEIKSDSKDFQGFDLEQGKVGVIANCEQELEIPLSAVFTPGNYYLIKLDYEQINRFGEMFLTYGASKSIAYGEDQLYLVIKGDAYNQLKLKICPKDIISYKVNLKHLMIINITNMKLQKEDIPHLPFI